LPIIIATHDVVTSNTSSPSAITSKSPPSPPAMKNRKKDRKVVAVNNKANDMSSPPPMLEPITANPPPSRSKATKLTMPPELKDIISKEIIVECLNESAIVEVSSLTIPLAVSNILKESEKNEVSSATPLSASSVHLNVITKSTIMSENEKLENVESVECPESNLPTLSPVSEWSIDHINYQHCTVSDDNKTLTRSTNNVSYHGGLGSLKVLDFRVKIEKGTTTMIGFCDAIKWKCSKGNNCGNNIGYFLYLDTCLLYGKGGFLATKYVKEKIIIKEGDIISVHKVGRNILFFVNELCLGIGYKTEDEEPMYPAIEFRSSGNSVTFL